MKRLVGLVALMVMLSGCVGFRAKISDAEYDAETGNASAGEVSLEVDGEASDE